MKGRTGLQGSGTKVYRLGTALGDKRVDSHGRRCGCGGVRTGGRLALGRWGSTGSGRPHGVGCRVGPWFTQGDDRVSLWK